MDVGMTMAAISLAVPALAQTPPAAPRSAAPAEKAVAPAKAKYGSINCVYDRLTPVQRLAIDVELIDSETNTALLEAPFTACGKQLKWPAELYQPVVAHLVARLKLDEAEQQIVIAGGRKGDVAKAHGVLASGDRDYLRGARSISDQAFQQMAPTLYRYGGAAVDGLMAYDEMVRMEDAWARLE